MKVKLIEKEPTHRGSDLYHKNGKITLKLTQLSDTEFIKITDSIRKIVGETEYGRL